MSHLSVSRMITKQFFFFGALNTLYHRCPNFFSNQQKVRVFKISGPYVEKSLFCLFCQLLYLPVYLCHCRSHPGRNLFRGWGRVFRFVSLFFLLMSGALGVIGSSFNDDDDDDEDDDDEDDDVDNGDPKWNESPPFSPSSFFSFILTRISDGSYFSISLWTFPPTLNVHSQSVERHFSARGLRVSSKVLKSDSSLRYTGFGAENSTRVTFILIPKKNFKSIRYHVRIETRNL